MNSVHYPFTAIVGQDRMKLALILNVINPGLSGVLIRGEKGTSKSTAVRALASILPEIEVVEGCPFQRGPDEENAVCLECGNDKCREGVLRNGEQKTVNRKVRVIELPLGATEDRVVGSINLEHALQHGEKYIDPGILDSVLRYVRTKLLPDIERIQDETDALCNALEGKHVPPGLSGSPSRGMADILPTERNFFSVNPFKIPGESAWKAGETLGDELVDTFTRDTGAPPETVAMVLWAGNTMSTLGEDVAEGIYLMGVRPVWNGRNGRGEGLEIIPSREVKFPRIDVTFRTSGLFRDTFPNVMELLDEAVLITAALEEPSSMNAIRKNVQREKKELIRTGMDPGKAEREASFRVFSDPPVGYGTGVPEMIETRQWRERETCHTWWIRFSIGTQPPK
jgi:cobalamin biosynthesis Mg chelatase CobN